ncbi:MAG: hypothetical protein NTW74_15495 [Acidobacteria bacterium]|nr:hypothetical protein [Acidobacteriota bacterium]
MRYCLLLSFAASLLAQPAWKMRTIAGGTEAGDAGRASDASIRFLQGVATDSLGNVYISDADDHRVRRVDRSGLITTLAGDGLPGFSGDAGPGSRSRVNTPYGLTVTPTGDLIFADLGNARIRRISRNGQIETIVGGGTREIPAAGQFIPPKEVRLIAPRNVLASPSGSLFISDFGANRVLELRSDGSLTSLPLTAVELNSPAGLALDAEGNILVADSGNARVRRIRRDGRVDILAAASKEMPLERPVGLARRSDGSLLIADTRGDFLWQLDVQGKSTILPPGGRDVAVDPFGSIVSPCCQAQPARRCSRRFKRQPLLLRYRESPCSLCTSGWLDLNSRGIGRSGLSWRWWACHPGLSKHSYLPCRRLLRQCLRL